MLKILLHIFSFNFVLDLYILNISLPSPVLPSIGRNVFYQDLTVFTVLNDLYLLFNSVLLLFPQSTLDLRVRHYCPPCLTGELFNRNCSTVNLFVMGER